MATKTRVKFDKEKYKKMVLKKAIEEQTRRLVAYAESELYKMIATHEFVNRTFNLADSYVWAVYYDKKREGYGFQGAKRATEKSYLHEWSKNPIPVDGRESAMAFLERFEGVGTIDNGWTIVWAACAPYGKYLDPKFGNTPTNRFYVISQRYDFIKRTLEPKCHVELKLM